MYCNVCKRSFDEQSACNPASFVCDTCRMRPWASLVVAILMLAIFLVVVVSVHGCEPKRYRVVGVTDGDTITVLTPGKEQLRVRLAEIDAPEKKQAFGSRAKIALSEKVMGRDIDLRIANKDRYGRSLGEVYLDGRNINLEMVAEGMAWHYTAYSRSTEMAEAQSKAKEQKLGLWADQNPTPPWQYRKKRGK